MTPHLRLCVLLTAAVVSACGSRPSPGALPAEALGIADDDSVAIGLDVPARGSAFIGCAREHGALRVSIAVLAEGRELSIDDRSVQIDDRSWPKVVTVRIDGRSFELHSGQARSVAEGRGFRITLVADPADGDMRGALSSGERVEVGALGTTYSARFDSALLEPLRETCMGSPPSPERTRTSVSEPAPSSKPRATTNAANVTGRWAARYFEGGGPGIAFTVELTEFDGVLTGEGTEQLRRADGTLATYRVQLVGSSDPLGSVEFSKTYEPSIGLRSTLVYEGRVSSAGDAIAGTWTVDGRHGTFTMARLGE